MHVCLRAGLLACVGVLQNVNGHGMLSATQDIKGAAKIIEQGGIYDQLVKVCHPQQANKRMQATIQIGRLICKLPHSSVHANMKNRAKACMNVHCCYAGKSSR